MIISCIYEPLTHSCDDVGTAFDTNEGGSLPLAFRGLRDESYAQGQLHAEAAKDLQTKIAEPFAEWAKGYRVCALSSWLLMAMSGWVAANAHG